MEKLTMCNIELRKLRPHPNNPRKKLGDLTELTESIRENGIMQNLTVVPDPDRDDGYMIVIGHRRAAAAKKAGLKEVPCMIALMGEADQVKLMLCENIQRNDLTVIEQAQGFQMMIDFGISVQDLAKETGFAPSTIYHRLNIAKLDQKALKKKLPDFTLADLIELEKIEDIETRNEILKKADRSTIAQKIQSAYADQEAEKRIEKLLQACIDAGLEKRQTNRWAGDIIIVGQMYAYDKEIPESEDFTDGATHYWKQSDTTLFTYRMRDDAVREEDPETIKIRIEKEKIVEQMGAVLDETNDAAQKISQEIDAFVEGAVKSGRYMAGAGEATREEFLVRYFLHCICSRYTPTSGSIDEFKPETYGLTSSYAYKGSFGEWFDSMHAHIHHELGGDPVLYAAISLKNMAASNRHITSRGATGFAHNGVDDGIIGSSGKELLDICDTLSLIGFDIAEDLVEYLSEPNSATARIKKLCEEYNALEVSK